MPRYDVLTFGETMLRLTPPGGLRLEQAHTLALHVGGSESNVAVGLARLGLRVGWFSRLPEHALGRLVEAALRAHGVDTEHILWAEGERLGLYFLEEGPPPRGSSVIYDRANSAMAHMGPDDLPQGLFHPEAARWLHLSGITPALGQGPRAAALRACELARAAGWSISFDSNYRARLWGPQAAREAWGPLLQMADVVFIPLRDAHLIYDIPLQAGPEAALELLAAHCPRACVALTQGEAGAAARTTDGQFYTQVAYPAEALGRVGGGDAFAAGFLYGLLTYDDTAAALKYGAALAALKYSTPGDMPMSTRAELETLAAGEAGSGLQR